MKTGTIINRVIKMREEQLYVYILFYLYIYCGEFIKGLHVVLKRNDRMVYNWGDELKFLVHI